MGLKEIIRNTAFAGALLAGALIPDYLNRANAGVISISDTTSAGTVGVSTLTMKNISGASEGYDGSDALFLNPPQTNALQIYTKINSSNYGIDAHPINTTGWDIYLGVKGSVNNINNYLRYNVSNTTDLTGRVLRLSDTGSLFSPIGLIMDGQYHNINLPNLTHGPGQYDQLRLDILDHSNASLDAGSNLASTTIDFGNVLKGANVASQSFTVYNRAVNTTAANTIDMKLTGFNSSGDSQLGTNLSNFNGLVAGTGNAFTASINTNDYTTTGVRNITLGASQLVDDSTLSGAGNNNNGSLEVIVRGNVGNAIADNNNSTSSFGAALVASIQNNGSYAGLESKVVGITGDSGSGLVGSTATILNGINTSGSSIDVNMSWRTQTYDEKLNANIKSDVMRLLTNPSGTMDSFVLQMDYDPSLLNPNFGDGALLEVSQGLFLAGLDPEHGWTNASLLTDSLTHSYHPGAWNSSYDTLGDWGLDGTNHKAWAVVNYNSDFGVMAVAPEPAEWVMMAGMGLTGAGVWWLRKLRKNRINNQDQEDSEDY